jgi:UDPglucose 6-dehydrogenase
MNICIVGTGYVGLVTGTLFAERGNNVVCVDKDPEIVAITNTGNTHFFEPGLKGLVKKNIKKSTLRATTDINKAVLDADVIFLCVNTPSNGNGSFQLDHLKSAASDVGKALQNASSFKIVVTKSTVPQGTHKMITEIINKEAGDAEWAYVSNPETLAEGTAIREFSRPDRTIIGVASDKAFEVMKELYHPFNIRRDRLMRGSPADAELAKLFSNTALACRIAMVNEFARIADHTSDADMDTIRRMVCSDSRIGYRFMFPSPGYGGSCFPKDIRGLVHQAELDGFKPQLLSTIHESNEAHKNYLGERLQKLLESKENPVIAVWGLTFKPNTDDMRSAASIPIVTRLINEGAVVIAYDPQDSKARKIFEDRITFASSQYDAVKGADALVLLTEWSHFDSPDYARLKKLMSGNKLFDLRNRWLHEAANRHGFDYFGVGRNYPLEK